MSRSGTPSPAHQIPATRLPRDALFAVSGDGGDRPAVRGRPSVPAPSLRFGRGTVPPRDAPADAAVRRRNGGRRRFRRQGFGGRPQARTSVLCAPAEREAPRHHRGRGDRGVSRTDDPPGRGARPIPRRRAPHRPRSGGDRNDHGRNRAPARRHGAVLVLRRLASPDAQPGRPRRGSGRPRPGIQPRRPRADRAHEPRACRPRASRPDGPPPSPPARPRAAHRAARPGTGAGGLPVRPTERDPVRPRGVPPRRSGRSQRLPGGGLAPGRGASRYAARPLAHARETGPAPPRAGERGGPGPVRELWRAGDGGVVPGVPVPRGISQPSYGGGRPLSGVTSDIPLATGGDPRRSVAKRGFVVGAGIMGSGIAAQGALSGYAVTLEDITEELVERGRQNLRRALDSAVKRGKVTPGSLTEVVARVDLAIGLRRADSAQIIIEAAPEKLELKRELFRPLEEA